MKDVHANGGTNIQDLCQTLAMTFQWSHQICTQTETDYWILSIVQRSSGNCVKKKNSHSSKICVRNHSKWLFIHLQVTLFYICPVNTSFYIYIVQNSHWLILYKYLYLLPHFKSILAFNLKLELWSKLWTETIMATSYSNMWLTSLRKSRKFLSRNNWPVGHFQMKFLLQTLLHGSTKSPSLF